MAEDQPVTTDSDRPDGGNNLATPPIQQPDITPVAEPTDIRFREPALNSGAASNLENLARSLQTLDGGLSNFLNARDQQQQQQDDAAARLAAIKNNGEGYAQAVAEGKIPAQASPAYISSYKEAQGDLFGLDLAEKANQAYDNWGGKDSTDPNAYRNFITGFIKQNVNTDDPDVLKGMAPHISQFVSELQARHIQDLHTSTTQGFTDTTVALGDKAVQAQRDRASATGQDFNVDGAWQSVMSYRSNYLSKGGTPSGIDNKIVDMIASQAEQADPDQGKQILTLLDRPIPGTDYTYAQTDYGAEKKLEAGDTLERMARQNLEDLQKLQTEANKEELGAIQTATLNYLVQNPGKPVPDSFIAAGSKQGLDPQFRAHVAEWQDTLLHNAGESNPQDIINLHWAIVNGDGASAIADALNQGRIHNATELDTALKLAAQAAKAQDIATPMLKTVAAHNVMKAIADRTLVKFDLNNPLAAPTISDEGLGLQLSFTKQIQQWALAHRDATEGQQQDAIAEIGSGVLGTIIKTGGLGPATIAPQAPSAGANPYLDYPTAPPPATAPTSAPRAAAAAPAPAPMLPPAAPPASINFPPAARAPRQQPQQQQPRAALAIDPSQQWYAGLAPDDKAQIQAYAAHMGASVNGVVQRLFALHQQRQQQLGGDAPQPQDPLADSSGTAGQLRQAFLSALHNSAAPVGGYAVAALTASPRAAHILDFISGPESRGNYNAFFGHADSNYDLSKMTLNQVMEWQQERVAAGSPSSATGRYQFMRSTLEGLKQAMHLTGDEKFTPVLQDEMALQLLKGRGYDEWVAGKLSDAQFANNLSEEWASLPNILTGRSQYEGDGRNRAMATPQQVTKALDAAAESSDSGPDLDSVEYENNPQGQADSQQLGAEHETDFDDAGYW